MLHADFRCKEVVFGYIAKLLEGYIRISDGLGMTLDNFLKYFFEHFKPNFVEFFLIKMSSFEF